MGNPAPVPCEPELPARDFTFIMDRLRWIDVELTRRRDIEWKITALHAAVYSAVVYLVSGERAKLSAAIGASTLLCWLFYAFVVSYTLIASCHLVYTHLRLNQQRKEKETLLRRLGQHPEPIRLCLWGFFEGWGAIFPMSFVAFVWVLGVICVLLLRALTVEENPPMSDLLAESVKTIVPFVISGLALGVSGVAVLLTWKWRSDFSRPQRIGNIPDYVRIAYLDMEINDAGGTEKNFRAARSKARELVEEYSLTNDGANQKAAPCDFHILSLHDGENGRPDRTPENQFCYKLSLSLEHVGLMVFVGALPLDVVLALVAPLIVDDWGFCRHLVQQIRKEKEWHRRHGEWLACVAAMWLAADKESPNDFAYLIERAGGLPTLSKREESIRKGEKHRLMEPPRDVQKFVKKLRKKLGKKFKKGLSKGTHQQHAQCGPAPPVGQRADL